MPYKSLAQERYFNAHRKELEVQGVDVDEWNSASKGMKLPQHKGATMKRHDEEEGLEGLTKPREKKGEHEGSKKREEKKRPSESRHPKGHILREIHTRQLHDGTLHHTHHYEDANGMPSHVQHEASSATPEDAGNYVSEQFGGGQQEEPEEQEPEGGQSPALGEE